MLAQTVDTYKTPSPSPPVDPRSMPLRVHSFVKRFGETLALKGITFELRNGECLGLLGPNGAGKSTLIRSIAGRVIGCSGTISVFGSPPNSAAARDALGWVPQDLALYGNLTCRENLQTFGRYNGLRGAVLAESVERCLEWTNLADRSGEITRNLSGGMKRRLNMAIGIIHRPRLVLMDEPTVGVDPQSRNHIFEMIDQLRQEGMSIIYTTHYMEEAQRLCDRIAIVDHGMIIAEGTQGELVQRTFGPRSELIARFARADEEAAFWVEDRGGEMIDGTAHFKIDNPGEIANLLNASALEGMELRDLTLRKPDLESVFLQLTGRELRD
jgi:ABC-2 type transport system ATP-binding protein